MNIPPENYGKFKKELEELINRYSMENRSNTPDYILAQYLFACLMAFNEATTSREVWHGRIVPPSVEEVQAIYAPATKPS